MPDLMHRPSVLPLSPALSRPSLPLQGITLLVVEDSRFAADALRLMCQRSGARMRRADSVQAARAHLCTYRPDIVVIDLGLPDGPGEGLIAAIAQAGPDAPVILGTSADPGGKAAALAAGASGFIDKPMGNLALFQDLILRHLPDRAPACALHDADPIRADDLALRDDMSRAADLAERIAGDVPGPGPTEADPRKEYLTGFVRGLAHGSADASLAAAVLRAATDPTTLPALARMLRHRCDQTGHAFDPRPA